MLILSLDFVCVFFGFTSFVFLVLT